MATRDQPIARELLLALEAFLAGDVEFVYDEALRTDQMHLQSRGVPRFFKEGQASFRATEQASEPD